MVWFQSYPYRFAGLLHEDATERQKLLDHMKDEWETWQEVILLQGSFLEARAGETTLSTSSHLADLRALGPAWLGTVS